MAIKAKQTITNWTGSFKITKEIYAEQEIITSNKKYLFLLLDDINFSLNKLNIISKFTIRNIPTKSKNWKNKVTEAWKTKEKSPVRITAGPNIISSLLFLFAVYQINIPTNISGKLDHVLTGSAAHWHKVSSHHLIFGLPNSWKEYQGHCGLKSG